jgi:hypothetical protein
VGSFVGNLRKGKCEAWRGVVLGAIFLWEVLFFSKEEREGGREGRGVVVLMILYMYL